MHHRSHSDALDSVLHGAYPLALQYRFAGGQQAVRLQNLSLE